MSKVQGIKDENFIVLQGFMVNKLQLKGNELFLYALIYGFSQSEDNKFTGSINYMCKWISASRPTVINTLKSLEEKGLIVKQKRDVQNLTLNEYFVNKDVLEEDETFTLDERNENISNEDKTEGSKEILLGVKNDYEKQEKDSVSHERNENTSIPPLEGSKEILLGVKKLYPGGKKTLRGGKKFLPNNIVNNIKIIYKEREKYIKRERVKACRFIKKDSPPSPLASVHELTEKEYNLLIEEFGRKLAMQKTVKAKKYTGCYTYEIIREWCQEDLQKSPPKAKNGFNNFEGRDYDMDALTKILIK
ncbi:DNA-binding PadR family transcriptional regulator [Lachnospiraceae bacterium PM6-15]|uniref:helix-turn-helix domain-containing protein n=1 Tax=Ohessyouella blattaphilus TaxID=2949333 RepID=UPI003E2D4889